MAILFFAVFLSGCAVTEELSCPENYILAGDVCCLDMNANGWCDNREAGDGPGQCPESCDDSDECTFDLCDKGTGYMCVNRPVRPCCGNGVCERGESYSTCSEDCSREGPPISLVSLSSWVDQLGRYAVVGELKNDLQTAVEDVRIELIFLDNESRTVGTIKTLSRISPLSPGQKSPFSVYFSGKYGMVHKIDDVKVDISYEETDDIPYSEFDIVESSGSYNARGGYDIVGGVRNTGPQKGRMMIIVASFNDKDGDIVAEKSTYIQPDSDEKPGETHQFFIGIPKESARHVHTYTLQVDTN